ncbi:hypothetical protein NKI72_31750 [Mesorhizobium sp. M0437]|uniref:hypothetical protein n=1 Tax=Mesorhizobium sp. M0437 TaxID=2956945 RepID=UPI00333978CC
MNSEKVIFDGMSAHGATATYSVFADVRLSGDGKACPYGRQLLKILWGWKATE